MEVGTAIAIVGVSPLVGLGLWAIGFPTQDAKAAAEEAARRRRRKAGDPK